MKFDRFTIAARPFITDAYCPQCGNYLREVSNGLLSVALFCPKDENVYRLKLVKEPKKNISEDYLIQCRKEIVSK